MAQKKVKSKKMKSSAMEKLSSAKGPMTGLAPKKRITLQYLIKHELPVWVRNKTSDPDFGREGGVVTLQAGSGDNISVVKIPPGNDPYPMSDELDPVALKACRDLFLAVKNGGLELLDPDDVEMYYEQNESRLEAMRSKIERYSKAPSGIRRLKGAHPPKMKKVGRTLEIDNPKIDYICQKAKAGAYKEGDAFERLLEISSVFTEADYGYIQSQGHYPGIKSWAKDQLAELAEAEIQGFTDEDE